MVALSQAGAQLIAKFEGTVLHLYNDPSGNCTIGIGHLIHLGPINGSEPQNFKAGITEQQALDLLMSDAKSAANCVTAHVKVSLTQGQADALISFVYNVGCGAFQTSDLLALLNKGDYASVPAQLMRWTHASGVELPGLVLRRQAEGALFAASQASQGGTMVTIPNGWHDDGTALTAPNGVKVVHGFRLRVLEGWHPDNWPLEAEYGTTQVEGSNPSLGAGTEQLFRWAVLEWTQARGVFEMWTGQELLYTRQQLAQLQSPTDKLNQIEQLASQIATLAKVS